MLWVRGNLARFRGEGWRSRASYVFLNMIGLRYPRCSRHVVLLIIYWFYSYGIFGNTNWALQLNVKRYLISVRVRNGFNRELWYKGQFFRSQKVWSYILLLNPQWWHQVWDGLLHPSEHFLKRGQISLHRGMWENKANQSLGQCPCLQGPCQRQHDVHQASWWRPCKWTTRIGNQDWGNKEVTYN